jgi:hypothetical protein
MKKNKENEHREKTVGKIERENQNKPWRGKNRVKSEL